MGMPGNGVNNRVLADIGNIVHITLPVLVLSGIVELWETEKTYIEIVSWDPAEDK